MNHLCLLSPSWCATTQSSPSLVPSLRAFTTSTTTLAEMTLSSEAALTTSSRSRLLQFTASTATKHFSSPGEREAEPENESTIEQRIT